ncbi:MAG: radical SAM protein [Elusimicrobiota bacterium]
MGNSAAGRQMAGLLSPKFGAVKRLEFHMSYACSQKCVFCSESVRMKTHQRSPLSLEEMARVALRKRKEGCEHITFVGGEPTVVPQFLDFLKVTRKLGYKTLLITNGGRLADPAFAAQVLPRLDEIVLSIHGHTPELHDELTGRKGSFAKLMTVFERIAQAGSRPFTMTNTVVLKRNIGPVREIVDFLTRLPAVEHCLLSNIAPDGRALEDYLKQAIRIKELGDLAPEFSRLAAERKTALRYFGMPLCVLGPAWRDSNDLYWNPRTNVERAVVGGEVGLEDTWSYTPERMRYFPEKCGECGLRDQCWGLFREYYDRFGDEELTPVGPGEAV